MSVVWNKDDFRIYLCDENIEDPNSTWDNSEPMDDGRYLVAAFFGLDNAKFLQAILAGEIEYPELKEYFDDLASGDYEKWKNGEITETRSGYDIDESCIEKYTNEEEWKQFLAKLLENGVTFGYCCVHFLISLDGKIEIVNNVRVEIENDGTYSRYIVPQQFLDALYEAWLEEARSEAYLLQYLRRALPEGIYTGQPFNKNDFGFGSVENDIAEILVGEDIDLGDETTAGIVTISFSLEESGIDKLSERLELDKNLQEEILLEHLNGPDRHEIVTGDLAYFVNVSGEVKANDVGCNLCFGEFDDETYYQMPKEMLVALNDAFEERVGGREKLHDIIRKALNDYEASFVEDEGDGYDADSFDDENKENWSADDFYVEMQASAITEGADGLQLIKDQVALVGMPYYLNEGAKSKFRATFGENIPVEVRNGLDYENIVFGEVYYAVDKHGGISMNAQYCSICGGDEVDWSECDGATFFPKARYMILAADSALEKKAGGRAKLNEFIRSQVESLDEDVEGDDTILIEGVDNYAAMSQSVTTDDNSSKEYTGGIAWEPEDFFAFEFDYIADEASEDFDFDTNEHGEAVLLVPILFGFEDSGKNRLIEAVKQNIGGVADDSNGFFRRVLEITPEDEGIGEGIRNGRLEFEVWKDGHIERATDWVRFWVKDDENSLKDTRMADAVYRALVKEAGGEEALYEVIHKIYRNYFGEEESVDMMSFIGQAISPSRYRGLTDRSRYELLDDRFAYIVDGVLICTDNECDIDCDGNICMVWPDGKVLHIGRVWMPESPEINKVKFSRSGNTLKQSCRVWYDNDHHHGGTEEEEIDLTPTPERRTAVETRYLVWDIEKAFRGVTMGNFTTSLRVSLSKKKSPNGEINYIELSSCWSYRNPRSYSKDTRWEYVYVNLTNGGFEDEDGNDITGCRLFNKLRCTEENTGLTARAYFCERIMPLIQKLYPNASAPSLEDLPPMYMRAKVLSDYLDIVNDRKLGLGFKDRMWVEKYGVSPFSYNKVAYEFSDDKIAEIFKHIK